MARRDPPTPTSKSALQQQDDAEAARALDLPLFSLAGLRARAKKIAAVALAASLLTALIGILLVTTTAASNFDVSAPEPLGLAKAGERINFSVTISNTAFLSAFAYETHVVGLPSGWEASSGEDLFALKAGEKRALTVSVITGGSAPPGHDYPVQLKVFVKSTDLRSNFANKTLPLNVKLLSSNVVLNLESHGTATEFSPGKASDDVSFAACGQSVESAPLGLPFNANSTNGGLTANFAAAANASGYLSLDIGSDGVADANASVAGAGSTRLNFNGSGLNAYLKAHPATTGNVSVPLRFTSCMSNATAWNFTLNGLVLNYHMPAPAGTAIPLAAQSSSAPQAETRVFVGITNNEPRDLTIVLAVPGLPTGWETSPPLSAAPIPVPARSQNTFEFTLRVAKTVAPGATPVNLSGCLQTNANDCASLNLTLDMPAAPYFTVKTYVEPAQLKDVFRGREVDILLFAQNLGNQPISFKPDPLVRAGLAFSWWNGSGDLGPVPSFDLAVSARALFVLTIKAEGTGTTTFVSLNPTFRNVSFALSQTLQLSVNVQDPPAASTPAALGNRLTVELSGATEQGLLFDTNQVSMIPLIDSKQRPTHPLFTKPAGSGIQPYEYTLQAAQNYTGLEHHGFEPYLAGVLPRETVVLWLTPAQTALPGNSFLKDTTVVFELRISNVAAA